MTRQADSPPLVPVRDRDRFPRACLSVALGLGWVVAIGTLSEPLGFMTEARNPNGWYLGRSAELLLFAAACVPLAFTHTRHASLLRIAATHSGVFALLATASVLFSPMPPFPILPWMDIDELAEPLFHAPLAVWAAGTATLAGIIHLGKRLAPKSTNVMTVEFGTLIACGAVAWLQWWITVRSIVGGWYLGSYYEGFGTIMARIAVGAAYCGIALVSARALSRTPG